MKRMLCVVLLPLLIKSMDTAPNEQSRGVTPLKLQASDTFLKTLYSPEFLAAYRDDPTLLPQLPKELEEQLLDSSKKNIDGYLGHLHQISAHYPGLLCALNYMPDNTLVSGGTDNLVRIWHADVQSGCSQTLSGHTATVNSITCTSPGTVISGSMDGYIRIWDSTTAETVRLFYNRHDIQTVASASDGTIIFGSNDNLVHLWDGRSPRENGILVGHTNTVYSVASKDNDVIFSSDGDGNVLVWDKKRTEKPCRILKGSNHAVRSVIGTKKKIIAGSCDNNIYIWGNKDDQPKIVDEHTGGIRRLTLGLNKTFISGSEDGTARIWNLKGQCARILAYGSFLSDLSCDATGSIIVAANGRLYKSRPFITRKRRYDSVIKRINDAQSLSELLTAATFFSQNQDDAFSINPSSGHGPLKSR